jgi:hypothetical protein
MAAFSVSGVLPLYRMILLGDFAPPSWPFHADFDDRLRMY